MLRALNFFGWGLILGGGVFLTSFFEHSMGISRFWAAPVVVAGGILLLVRYFKRQRRGDDV